MNQRRPRGIPDWDKPEHYPSGWPPPNAPIAAPLPRWHQLTLKIKEMFHR